MRLKGTRRTRKLGSIAAALASLAVSLVGITATATPAAAAPSCTSYAWSPYWHVHGTKVQGDGQMHCSATMNTVRVEVEVAAWKSGTGWTTVGKADKVVRDWHFAYATAETVCKGTGRMEFVTKGRGTALAYGFENLPIKDPSDGGWRYSYSKLMDCGNPPPPPTVEDICRAIGGPMRASTMRSSSTDSGSVC